MNCGTVSMLPVRTDGAHPQINKQTAGQVSSESRLSFGLEVNSGDIGLELSWSGASIFAQDTLCQ
jgi:hypothetical protein